MDREARLLAARVTARQSRLISFDRSINVFADVPCMICRKNLYPQQRYNMKPERYAFLPQGFSSLNSIVTCQRCLNTVKKGRTPAQAYWNKMEVTIIPKELDDLTEVEKRFLSRIVPFLRIIKVQNRFSQHWCKGQLVLFAQDVMEIAEQLPLRPNQAGVIIIAESRQCVQSTREFQVNMENLKTALKWLLENNDLYKDVRPNFTDVIDIQEGITHVVQEQSIQGNRSVIPDINREVGAGHKTTYTTLDQHTGILRGTFHQGSERFAMESRGRQCTAIAVVACVAFKIISPDSWTKSDIDYILILGDRHYQQSIAALDNGVPPQGFLLACEVLRNITFDRKNVRIEFDEEASLNGHLKNNDVIGGFPNLKDALIELFTGHSYALLTTNSTTVALCCKEQDDQRTYWLFDSHSRGPKGYNAPSKGTSCCMRFEDMNKLHALLMRNFFLKNVIDAEHTTNIFSLTPVRVELVVGSLNQAESEQMVASEGKNEMIYTTNMLRDIDEEIPNLENIVSVNNPENGIRLAEVSRKTIPPLRIEQERRMEELGFYFLFPDGKNGFGENREVKITPLDYFQTRIMGSDKRFQRTDYLFFALSVVEYYRTKASVSVSCRMRQADAAPQGLVDNMHLTMRNVRGSASYWSRCCSELIAMVRCIGPPTWFLTFSCNDLNWDDMMKALLIADGRNESEGPNLSFPERLALVQKYPVVISRQFTIRVNSLMAYLRHNHDCLGGPMKDFWYRIEFQNRGSPHLHMLIWCDNIPDFQTNEGKQVIEKVVSCSLTPDDTEMQNLVKNLQIHKHSKTCYKDRENSACRFGFPKPERSTTECVAPDEALKNNGRFCLLQRTKEESMVNNYNPELLCIWKGNLDIQPCGNVTSVAYYVAKYASKCEPHDTGEVVREAVRNAKRRGGVVWNQLFSVSMAILSQRLVSATECAYRLCHLPLKMSSRKAVFINSCVPDQRYRLLRTGSTNVRFWS